MTSGTPTSNAGMTWSPGIAGQVIPLQSRNLICLCPTLLLSNHQAIEEEAITLQGLAEIFSRDIIALIPQTFQ